MSVINQMLKDLDERNPESINPAMPIGKVAETYSTKKIVAITALSVVIICLLSFYIWQVISENNALKAEKESSQVAHQENAEVKHVPQHALTSSKARGVESVQVTTATNAVAATQPALKTAEHEVEKKLKPVAPKPVANNNSSRVTPAKKAEAFMADHSLPAKSSVSKKAVSSEQSLTSKKNISKMSVSRRQLSADELAEQKLELAERALAAKQISKAEKLLEEVVIIKPRDSQTRKKLAALWYGRKAYQNAVNLLSQGIALDRKDSSLRELKARIYLKQGQVNAALNTLKPLSKFKNEQYQVMLANVAQQAQQNEIAADAYQLLISMQPEIGRWQLGLAVLYDKNSQFNLASAAYKKALIKNDLSVSSESFIKERLEVLGQ